MFSRNIFMNCIDTRFISKNREFLVVKPQKWHVFHAIFKYRYWPKIPILYRPIPISGKMADIGRYRYRYRYRFNTTTCIVNLNFMVLFSNRHFFNSWLLSKFNELNLNIKLVFKKLSALLKQQRAVGLKGFQSCFNTFLKCLKSLNCYFY